SASRGMLRLHSRTPETWAQRLLPHVEELLVEQAHLEKKAASAALTFVFRYPDHPGLHRALSAAAREELEHFERTLALLERRGLEVRRLAPGPYAERLLAVVRPREPERMLDQMLCNSVIEARSCERMKPLASALDGRDAELARFW